MTDQELSRLLSDPRVHELVALRRRRYLVLSAIVSVVYAVVAIACAFAPDILARPVIAGSSVSLAIVSMVLVMVVGIACSGYYTWWSNTVRDPLTERIVNPGLRQKT